MLWPRQVTILGLFLLSLSPFGVVQAAPVSLSMRVAGQGTVVQTAQPYAALAATLEYKFYQTFLIGAEYSYLRPFTHFQDYMNNGMNDMALYLGDSELWVSKPLGLKLSVRVGGILPTSLSSREASLRYGLTGQATLKKTFNRSFSMSYRLAGGDYDHQYATAVETQESLVFNTRWDVHNRFSLNYLITKSLSLDSAFLVSVYNDYNDVTYNIYQLSGGFTWELAKYASIDFGFRTKMRDANGVGTYVGAKAAEHFFDPNGTSFYVGATFSI